MSEHALPKHSRYPVLCGILQLSLRQSCSSLGRRLMINEWNQLSFINEQFSVADRRVCSSQRERDSEREGGERVLKRGRKRRKSAYSTLIIFSIASTLPCGGSSHLKCQ